MEPLSFGGVAIRYLRQVLMKFYLDELIATMEGLTNTKLLWVV